MERASDANRARAIWAALALALLAAASAPGPAGAAWTRIAQRPTNVEPFQACPARPRRAHCDLLVDPTSGRARTGPLPAGAITVGPEQQVSPALSGSGVEGGYSPENLRSAYDLPSASAGTGQTVAVVDAYNDPDAEADLAQYRAHYKLPECTHANGCLREVNESGGSSLPQPEPRWAEEISLDLDMVSAICPNCHILLVEASNAETASLASAVDEAASLGATEISNSYGSEEASEPLHRADYDHAGVPITAAAGDSGYGVEWPAADPYVIAVGGTSLERASNARGWKEAVWYTRVGNEVLGTGSGCSEEPKPAWQTDSGCSYRTDNDVAAVASQNTPVSVYDSYATRHPWNLLGGTSVATPIIAAAMALATPYTRSFEGADALYIEAALNGTGALDDITVGKNGSCGNYLCEAEIGYDGPTGLGSPWGAPEVPPPSFTTQAASAVAATSAQLNALVAPNGVSVDCRFEWGTGGSFDASSPCSDADPSGTSMREVSASLTHLSAETTYDFRVAGSYGSGGSGAGEELTFTTSPSGVSATTGAASELTQSSALLAGTVDPGGHAVSGCRFEYGRTDSYGSSVACAQTVPASDSPVEVSAALKGLAAGASYHFRVTLTTEAGSASGADEVLQTAPATAPAVETRQATEVGQNTAILDAAVNPELAQLSSCTLQYGTSASLGKSVACAQLPGPVGSPVEVSAAVKGLKAHTTYRFRISASSPAGTSYGSEATFQTAPALAPSVQTLPASEVTQSAATLNADVDPHLAQLSECSFQYGTNATYGRQAACAAIPGPGSAAVAVSARVTGLRAGATYHFRIVAVSGSGTSRGADQVFETPSAATAGSALAAPALAGLASMPSSLTPL